MGEIDKVASQHCVCFVCLEMYPTTPGGAGILVSQTMQILLNAGYNIVLLLAMNKTEFTHFNTVDRFKFPRADQIIAYRVEDITAHCALPHNLQDDVYVLSARIALAIIELRKLHTMDLIEFYDYCGPGWHSLGCAELFVQPMIVRMHSTIELISHRVRDAVPAYRSLHFHQERDQLRLADGVVFSGPHFLREEAQEVYPFLVPSRMHRSPPPLLGFEPHPPREGARDVLFYGRLSTLKGLDTFLRGVALALADPQFSAWARRIVIAGPVETVAGGLTLDEMLAVIPREMRERLHFVGRVTHHELQRLLPDIAFAVFANRLESFCYAAHELRVSGVPLILSTLPTFRDFFVDGETAVFFNGAATDLAEKMRYLAGEPDLRARLSNSGIRSAPGYMLNHYDDHIAAVKPRRVARSGAGLAVTVMIFSNGDAAAEARTIASARAPDVNAVVLRPDAQDGWRIAGTRFHNDPGELRSSADCKPVGDAVLGLRAGDVVDLDWLAQARATLEGDPLIGVVAGWRLHADGIRSSADHLVPELALMERMGLRRLIRLSGRMIFAEAAGLLKNAGEVGLILAARAAGLALVESPRVAVDVRQSCETPRFDAQAAMQAEADRLNVKVLARLPDLARMHLHEAPRWREAFGQGALSDLADILGRGLCRIVVRPDIAQGEVWLLRVFHKQGAQRASWADFDFSDGWRQEKQEEMTVGHVAAWSGEVSFAATDETTIDLLQGPFCGACEVRYGVARAIIDLKQQTVADVTLRLRDLSILEAGLSQAPANAAPSRHPERPLAPVGLTRLLTIMRPDGWTARRAAPFGAPTLSSADFLASGVLNAAARLVSLRRSGEVDGVAIEIDSVSTLHVLEQAVTAGLRDVTAILPAELSSFDGQTGYAASVLAAGALAGLARRAHRDGPGFAVAASDDALRPLFEAAGAPFLHLPTASARPRWDQAGGPPTVVISDASAMAEVRTHLVAAAMILRRRLGRELRLFVPAADIMGEALLREFRVFGGVRYDRLESQVGVAPGPAVALSVYPDPVVSDASRDVAALGFAPLLGPAAFRWATADRDADARRFRVRFWDDAATIAAAAEAVLTDWSGARDAYDRLWRAEADIAAAARTRLWGSATAAAGRQQEAG